MLERTSEEMRCFAERYGTAITDPDLVDRYEAYVSSQHEEASRRIVAEREAARKAAREATIETEARTRREMARGMRDEGIAPDVLARVTCLAAEEIEAL